MKITFIRKGEMPRTILLFICMLMGVAGLFYIGCKTMDTVSELGTAAAAKAGLITHGQKRSLERSAKAISKTFEDITPEQEYYIGRTVGAMIIDRYGVYENEAATKYINVLGQTIAQFSNSPETFGGYHFLIINTDEVNAFAAPGGFIFVSKGMIRCCMNEDDLAAVLAHEIGHVQNKDGLRAISAGRITEALTIVGEETVKTTAGVGAGKLTEIFAGSIKDIVSTLVVNGYSRKQEYEADAAAVQILNRVGYTSYALVNMLSEMERQIKPDGLDFAKTHPRPEDRIKEIQPLVKEISDTPVPVVRQDRFQNAIGNI